MCGFVGGIDFKEGLNKNICQSSLKLLSHRGPDSEGFYFSSKVFLGHKRLSIIDLSSAANQPFCSKDNKYKLIFNGEIYNYKDLKNSLNISFETSSDTEVILQGYILEGINFFKKLRGIYAFAIYDSEKDIVILVRDPGGIKPLYILNNQKGVIFSSEIKGVLPHLNSIKINDQVIKSYLSLGYCPEPFTAYEDIEAVKPGYVYTISSNGIRCDRFYSYEFLGNNGNSFKENLKHVEYLVENAVKKNLVSDVPVAIALSGGIDSSLIYAYGIKADPNLKGLSVSFNDDAYDETDIARIYSETVKGNLEIINIEREFNLEMLDKILIHFDQPYADSSAIPVYFLTKATRKNTKVLLGGDGGDELFNGYPSQTWLYYLYFLKKKGFIKKSGDYLFPILEQYSGGSKKRIISRLNNIWNRNPSRMLYEWHSWIPSNTKFNNKEIFKFDSNESFGLYDKVFEEDIPDQYDQHIVFDYFRKRMLSDYMRKTDMMSMMNGIEYRVPLLDEELTSFAFSIPFSQKSDLRNTKIFLRTLHKKIYPKATSNLAKKGFTIPLDKNLSKNEFDKMEQRMTDSKDNILLEYISKDYINYLFKLIKSPSFVTTEISRAGIYQRILIFYSLQLWYKNTFKK